MSRHLVCACMVAAALAGLLLGCSRPAEEPAAADGPSAAAAAALEALSPGAQVQSAAEADLDDDGATDAVLVFRDAEERFRTVVLLDSEGEATPTEQFKAPVERQSIEVRDIDGEPPTEFVVRGWKGSTVGYAIYRIEDGALVDVFGSNMADCCGN